MKKDLRKKLAFSELVIREAVEGVDPDRVNILYSGGKDSTTVLHIVKNIYRGKVPFRVTHADPSYEFPEIYEFIERITRLWKLRLDQYRYMSSEAINRFEASGRKNKKIFVTQKAIASKKYTSENRIEVSLSGIRWYEHFHKINKFKTTYHGMKIIYPILHWTHQDVWDYIKEYGIPYCPLYDQGYTHIDMWPFSLKDGKPSKS